MSALFRKTSESLLAGSMSFFTTVSLSGRSCILVLPHANWGTPPRISHAFDTEDVEADTGVMGRAPNRLVMRISQIQYQLQFLNRAKAQEFLDTIDGLTDQKLLLPLWPDLLPAADYTSANRIYTAQNWVNYNPATGAYAINLDAGHSHTVGLVMAVLSDSPKLASITDGFARVTLRAEEDSPMGARVEINTSALADWTFEAEYSAPPETHWKSQLARKAIGRGREKSTSGEESVNKRGQRAGFKFNGRQKIRQALTFWADKFGSLKSFEVPLYFRPSWDGTPETKPTMLARFESDVFTLEYVTTNYAKTELTFIRELELVEGQPPQERPPLANLYCFYWTGSTALMTFTDWETPITVLGRTYDASKAIEHRAPTENLRPGTSEWEILVRDFVGNPLRAFTLLALERKLNLEIHECDPTNAAASVRARFIGEILSAPNTGKVYNAKAVLLGGKLKFHIPDFYCQRTCNFSLYSEAPECGVNQATYQKTGTLAAASAAVVDVSTTAAQTAEYFAEGYAEFGTGDATEIRYILHSVPISGGQRLTLHRPLRAIAAGAAVVFYPGCDNQFEGGCAKFGNQDNFGGAPHQPAFMDSVSSGFKMKAGK